MQIHKLAGALAAFSLLAVSPVFAQSSSRGIPTAQPNTFRALPQGVPIQSGNIVRQPTTGIPSQPNTFVPNGTVVQPGSGSRVVFPAQSNVVAQPSNVGSTTRGSATRGSTTRTMPVVATFEQNFWNYLVRSKYRNWAPVPGKSDAMYEGQSPHGAFLKMYLNRTAAGNPAGLPSGSIVIKENYGKDEKTLMAITVMYKNNGYNRDAGDWYWVKYNPDGSVASKATDAGVKSLAGRVGGCISCHEGAGGDDYAFFND